MATEEEGAEKDSDWSLTGFLFGNINEKGELEDESILDEESRRHLSRLESLGGLGSLVKDISSLEERSERVNLLDKVGGSVAKAYNAADFSEINELADDEEANYRRGLKFLSQESKVSSSSSKDENYDDDYDDSKTDIHKDSLTKAEQDRLAMPPPIMDNGGMIKQDGASDTSFLPQTSNGKTVLDLFPEFRPGKVLRFSRLFWPAKPSSLPQLWRNAKKRRKKKKKQEDPTTPVTPSFKIHDEYESDDEDRLMRPIENDGKSDRSSLQSRDGLDKEEEKMCAWRHGPAALWYEMLGVNEDGTNLDYGFKLKEQINIEEEKPNTDEIEAERKFPSDDCFHLVAIKRWEDDIIWSPEDVKLNPLSEGIAGWIPSANIRTTLAYANQRTAGSKLCGLEQSISKTKAAIKANHAALAENVKENKPWYSIFPVDNQELIYGRWEDKIIWDSEAMPNIPEPEIMELDPNDENLILGIPEDVVVNAGKEQEPTRRREPKNKSKLLLGKSKTEDEDEGRRFHNETLKDPFNISNDKYYNPKHTSAESSLQATMGTNRIQHSTPAMELQRPFFPTFNSKESLRHFHRPLLKRVTHGKLSVPGPHPVSGLLKHIKKKAKERQKERLASGGGEVFFMRDVTDLTGMDGDLILAEYCEEYPPLIMAVGMNTRIIDYYKRKHGKDEGAPNFEYGETLYIHQTSPFLGQLKPGESLQALESNLYRAPIYEHAMPSSDFVIIKTNNSYYIREVKTIFCVGQECPKFEVPGPNSKKANNHARDFLQVFIYRLFWKSPDNPRRIKMDDIKRAFPHHSESSIRKRLKLCADFKRTGVDCNWWVLKNDFRLPSEDEMRALVTPEQCCGYLSMQAAEQRLKDAGYGEKNMCASDDDNEEENQKIDDEVRTAPWNTTRAFISAMRGKCQLAVSGPADPTGCGEGFSYVRVPNKPIASKDENSAQSASVRKQKTVTGTDADLRRLSLKDARKVLRNFGIPEEEIKKLSRWEVIDVVRTRSTQAAKSGEERMSKFARGSRFSIAEHQERYKEECQRIFELQNGVLSSTEVLSTDEESSSDEDSDYDELGKNLESMLSNKKSSSQLTHEQEEVERLELQRLFANEDSKDNSDSKGSSDKVGKEGKNGDDDDTTSVMSFESSVAGRRLLIQRTFKDEEGRQYTRTEVVKNQPVIDAYLKYITKDKNYRENFASQDEVHKEEIRRERRRIQEQLRRIKRNQEKEREKALQPKKKKEKTPNNLKCGACGEIGHMRTNKNCPQYQEVPGTTGPIQVAMTDEQVAEHEMNMPQDDLVKVEGTKITLGKAFLDHANDLKRRSMVLRIPKELVKKRRRSGLMHCDYLTKRHKQTNRRRTNPVVVLQLILENISTKLKEIKESRPFHTPVSIRTVPDYYKIVMNPMDLQTIKENIRKGLYRSREEFLQDTNLLYSNCVLYNGDKHSLTEVAKKITDLAKQMIDEKEEEITQIEKDINPLLSDDPQTGFSWMLENVIMHIKASADTWPFHRAVSAKNVPDYYEIVKQAMDLEKLRSRVLDHFYRNREEFMADVNLILNNCILYNGDEHPFSSTCRNMVKKCEELLKESADQFAKLEENIATNPYYDEIDSESRSSYVASQPPSESGEIFNENSLDEFPSSVLMEETMDSVYTNEDNSNQSCDQVFSAAKSERVHMKSADDDMDVDVVGSGEESLNQSNVTTDELDKDIAAVVPAAGENSLTLEKLLQDLETSPQHDESDESGDDDFPFDDGDDDDVEDEEEPGDEERLDETIEDIEDNGEDTSRDTTE
ncbi:transcription initiation factor TFIID subunit 1 isoform X2 [Paramuricea clavata]|uniref:Transcription initiation factor TFIID subunit 1 n=1 Tax=Paramuricea clavata TaxID=317549 RepID=A0A7D9D906_PARCT|nr:transcription initiation factor TFIID subunit 1 isoform X2 [Paramuricea clavata]